MQTQTTTRTRKLALASAYVVAAIAGVESYSHIRHVAEMAGQSAILAALLPFSVDGLVVVGTLALAARRRNFTAWLAVILGVAATLGANIAAAQPTTLGRVVSAWPAVAFLVATEVVLKGASKAAEIAITAEDAAAAALAAKRSASARQAAATRKARREAAELEAAYLLPAAPVSPAA